MNISWNTFELTSLTIDNSGSYSYSSPSGLKTSNSTSFLSSFKYTSEKAET